MRIKIYVVFGWPLPPKKDIYFLCPYLFYLSYILYICKNRKSHFFNFQSIRYLQQGNPLCFHQATMDRSKIAKSPFFNFQSTGHLQQGNPLCFHQALMDRSKIEKSPFSISHRLGICNREIPYVFTRP